MTGSIIRFTPARVKWVALAVMEAAQRDWLKKRNQCQADAACLTKSMHDRTFELVSKIQ